MKFILSKVLGFPTAIAILFVTFCSVNTSRAQNLQEDDLALVEGLLDQMTLEDKVGQMTQLTLGFLSTSQKQHDGRPKKVDWEKMRVAIEQYRVGSILNSAGNAYPIEEWHRVIEGYRKLPCRSLWQFQSFMASMPFMA